MIRKAIIDIDNTLWHFCDALYEELRKVNGSFPAPGRWTHWDMWEKHCSLDEFLSAVNAVHLNQHSDRYLPYPEAKEFLSSLKENGYHIIIASHRSPDYRRQTEKWLKKHDLVYDELDLSFQKTRLFDSLTDVVVDDAPDILEKAVEHGVMATGLLFPWNREYAGNGFRLFQNLNQVLEYVLNSDLDRD